MSEEQPSFTAVNYLVCMYCEHLVRGPHRDGYNDGCKLVSNDEGKYARQTMFSEEPERLTAAGIDFVEGMVGCEEFSPNGVPVHSSLRDRLVKANPKFTVVSVDDFATETSWDFDDKVTQSLDPSNITSYDKIQ